MQGPKIEYAASFEVRSETGDAGKITTQLGTPRGRYDEHSSKSSLSKKLRFVKLVGKRQTSEGDAY
jgi:hypothetical protein